MLATLETLSIMGARGGPQDGQPVGYGETMRLGDIDLRFVPPAMSWDHRP